MVTTVQQRRGGAGRSCGAATAILQLFVVMAATREQMWFPFFNGETQYDAMTVPHVVTTILQQCAWMAATKEQMPILLFNCEDNVLMVTTVPTGDDDPAHQPQLRCAGWRRPKSR